MRRLYLISRLVWAEVPAERTLSCFHVLHILYNDLKSTVQESFAVVAPVGQLFVASSMRLRPRTPEKYAKGNGNSCENIARYRSLPYKHEAVSLYPYERCLVLFMDRSNGAKPTFLRSAIVEVACWGSIALHRTCS